MYMEITGFTNKGKLLVIKFHEGPLHNKEFKDISPFFILSFLAGEKIPLNRSKNKVFADYLKKGIIRMTENDEKLYKELEKHIS